LNSTLLSVRIQKKFSGIKEEIYGSFINKRQINNWQFSTVQLRSQKNENILNENPNKRGDDDKRRGKLHDELFFSTLFVVTHVIMDEKFMICCEK
jgi:hypothetical protein